MKRECCKNCMSSSYNDEHSIICQDPESSNYLGCIDNNDICSFFDVEDWSEYVANILNKFHSNPSWEIKYI